MCITGSYWYYVWKNWFVLILIYIICFYFCFLFILPSWPCSLPPHDITSIDSVTINTCVACWNVTDTKHCWISAKLNGYRRSFALSVPSPSWFWVFSPHAYTLPEILAMKNSAGINLWCGNSSVYIYINYTRPYSFTGCIYGTNCCRTVLSRRNKLCSVNLYYIFIIRNKVTSLDASCSLWTSTYSVKLNPGWTVLIALVGLTTYFSFCEIVYFDGARKNSLLPS